VNALVPTSKNRDLSATPTQENDVMLLHEALARSRMREAEQAARDHRLARRVAAGRNWQRLARWTAARAAKASAGR